MKSGDRADSPTPASDFTAADQPSSSEAHVAGGATQANERLCAVAGCDRPSRSRGWCAMHYQRWEAHGDPLGASPEPDEEPRSEDEWTSVLGAEMSDALDVLTEYVAGLPECHDVHDHAKEATT